MRHLRVAHGIWFGFSYWRGHLTPSLRFLKIGWWIFIWQAT